MGTPLSAEQADLVLEDVILNAWIKITFFKRYANDCLAAFPKKGVDKIHTASNNYSLNSKKITIK